MEWFKREKKETIDFMLADGFRFDISDLIKLLKGKR